MCEPLELRPFLIMVFFYLANHISAPFIASLHSSCHHVLSFLRNLHQIVHEDFMTRRWLLFLSQINRSNIDLVFHYPGSFSSQINCKPMQQISCQYFGRYGLVFAFDLILGYCCENHLILRKIIICLYRHTPSPARRILKPPSGFHSTYIFASAHSDSKIQPTLLPRSRIPNLQLQLPAILLTLCRSSIQTSYDDLPGCKPSCILSCYIPVEYD